MQFIWYDSITLRTPFQNKFIRVDVDIVFPFFSGVHKCDGIHQTPMVYLSAIQAIPRREAEYNRKETDILLTMVKLFNCSFKTFCVCFNLQTVVVVSDQKQSKEHLYKFWTLFLCILTIGYLNDLNLIIWMMSDKDNLLQNLYESIAKLKILGYILVILTKIRCF